MMIDRLRFCVAGLLVAMPTACSSTTTRTTTIERVTSPEELKPLAFLSAGEVSRRNIEARLGAPWSTFEDRRNLTLAGRAQRGLHNGLHARP